MSSTGTASEAELDAKLTDLLRLMVHRLPSSKTLPTPVVQQLLRGKYAETYPEAYLSSRASFISDTIAKLTAEKEKTVAVAAKTAAAAAGGDEADKICTSDDDDSDDDDSESDEEGDEDEEEDEDDDDDDEDEDEEDDDEDDSDDSEGEPEMKKVRQEEAGAFARKVQPLPHDSSAPSPAAAGAALSLAERCQAMATCLRKLGYRVRAPAEEESLEDYLQRVLIAEFKKHGMDPEKYSTSDIKRYRIQREVELLQQDGASLSLDRRQRAGRGFTSVTAGPQDRGNEVSSPTTSAMTTTRPTSMFLDDE